MKKTKLSETGSLEQMSNEQIMFSAMYGSMAARLKPKGSNYTPSKEETKKEVTMGINKKHHGLNQAKNKFVKWLKQHKAKDIDIYEGNYSNDEYYYYREVSAWTKHHTYIVTFGMWKDGIEEIYYYDSENSYKSISIEEFLQLIQ